MGVEVGTKAVATLAGVGAFAEIREAGRYPGRSLRPARRGDRPIRIESVDAQKEPYLVAEVTPLDDEVGDEPRAERLAAPAIRRFVRYLDLMRARDGESAEVLDIRVEIEATVGEPDPRRRSAGRPPEPSCHLGRRPADAQRSRHPRRSDRPLVPAVGHRPGRAPAAPGPARGATRPSSVSKASIALLEREVLLLGRRLRYFTPDPRRSAELAGADPAGLTHRYMSHRLSM